MWCLTVLSPLQTSYLPTFLPHSLLQCHWVQGKGRVLPQRCHYQRPRYLHTHVYRPGDSTDRAIQHNSTHPKQLFFPKKLTASGVIWIHDTLHSRQVIKPTELILIFQTRFWRCVCTIHGKPMSISTTRSRLWVNIICLCACNQLLLSFSSSHGHCQSQALL